MVIDCLGLSRDGGACDVGDVAPKVIQCVGCFVDGGAQVIQFRLQSA
jgi:hypothetical protein